MAARAWDQRSAAAWQREQDQLVARWTDTELRPFSRFWADRLRGLQVRSAADLTRLPVALEADLAGAGGPGNPALLLLPTEDEFKRSVPRSELLAAARELRGGGAAARRAVLHRRYKPVHVHEAGVAALMAVAYTRTDLDRLHLAGARLVEVLGLGADDALVNAVPAGPSVRFWGLYHAALAARMTALHPRGTGQDPVVPVARALALLPATVLAVPVGEALDLLDGLADRGVGADRLRTVLVVGPPPAPARRAAIADAARALGAGQVRVQAVWAPEASRVLYGECRPVTADPDQATYGLHTYPDLEVLSVRAVADDRTAGPGEPGELVLTSAGWRGTAFVRLATGAWVGGLVRDVPCPSCGRRLPRLAPDVADAAWQPRVEDGEGRWVRVDLRPAEAALRRAGLERARVRSWSLRPVDGTLVLALDLPPADTDTAAHLGRAVGAAIGLVPEVRISRRLAASRPQVGDAGPAGGER